MRLQEIEKYEEIKEKLKLHQIEESIFDGVDFESNYCEFMNSWRDAKHIILKDNLRILIYRNEENYRVYFENGARSNRKNKGYPKNHGFDNDCEIEGFYWENELLK